MSKRGKTVFVVTSGSYSDYSINAIFSTREKAQGYIDGMSTEYSDFNGIEEWELDELADPVKVTCFACHLGPGGEVQREWTFEQVVGKGQRYTQKQAHPSGVLYSGYSSVSAQHARKLAAEARQEHLRAQVKGDQ